MYVLIAGIHSRRGCAACGTQRKVETPRVCTTCQTELRLEQGFCPKCGRRFEELTSEAVPVTSAMNGEAPIEKKKKKNLVAIILAIVVAVAGIGGYVTYSIVQENKRQEAIAEYKMTATSFYELVIASGKRMETIGNAIQSAWGGHIQSRYSFSYYNDTLCWSIDDAVAAAQDEQQDEIDSVENSDSQIQRMYKELQPLPDTELQQIKADVQILYDAYTEMYDVVIDVSGNYTSFKSDFADADQNLASAIKNLTARLK